MVRVKLGRIETLPIWVTVNLKELGKLMLMGTGRGFLKEKEETSKHMCSDALESMIQFAEFKT